MDSMDNKVFSLPELSRDVVAIVVVVVVVVVVVAFVAVEMIDNSIRSKEISFIGCLFMLTI